MLLLGRYNLSVITTQIHKWAPYSNISSRSYKLSKASKSRQQLCTLRVLVECLCQGKWHNHQPLRVSAPSFLEILFNPQTKSNLRSHPRKSKMLPSYRWAPLSKQQPIIRQWLAIRIIKWCNILIMSTWRCLPLKMPSQGITRQAWSKV